jgi:hypothetical protein
MQKLNLKSIYMFCRNCSFSYIDHNKIGFTKTIWLNPLLLDFSPVFKYKVVQTLNTKVAQQVTLYKNAKGSRGFYSLVWAGTTVQVDQVLGAQEQCSNACFCIFHTLPLQTSNANLQESCVPCKTAHFSYWVIFEVFRGILENVPKF